MDFITIFFSFMSIVVVLYIFYLFKSKRRMSIKFELFYIAIYGFVAFIFLFPNTLKFIEKTLGIASALNFIVYLSVFVAYFIIFLLYTKSEQQRQEITALTREIAYLKKDKKK